MLNRNNSLLNLMVILSSFFFFTVLSAENNDFILPKKKFFVPSNDDLKTKKETIKVDNKFNNLPRKKPLEKKINISKKIESKEKKITFYDFNLPQKKPLLKKEIRNKELVEKFLETKKESGGVSTNILEIDDKSSEIKKSNQDLVSKNNFLYPLKKPLNFKASKIKIAEKSAILNTKDYSVAKEVFNFIKKKKWINAIKLSKKVKDKEFNNLVKWLYLKERSNQATFNEYAQFISNNSDYPRISRLRYLAEHKILIQNSSPQSIINWFNGEEPLSGVGKIKLGEAYLRNGQDELGIDSIKNGWINADLSSGDLKYYRKKFKNILKIEDNLKRADYLAWENKYWDLKRMFRYLPKNETLLYKARFILQTNSYGVDKAISDVPENMKKDLGLQYDRLKWRTRRNRLESSLEILRSFHGEENLVHAEKWWNLRENITRDLIYEKKYSSAYEISSNHHLFEGPEFADAEWISGWLSLSFLNQADLAIKHFTNFYNNVGYPISIARGAYWLGLAYEKKGNKEKANNYFEKGAEFTNTFYGQLSFNKIKLGKNFKLTSEFMISDLYEKEFNKNRLIKLVRLLKELERTEFSKDIIKHLASLNVEKGSEILAAKLATEVERYDYAIQISKSAAFEKRFINIYNYPVVATPSEIKKRRMPSQNLILAIIRQESEFDSKANSYVGAQGLMQIMPATAKIVAKNVGTTYSKNLLKEDPSYNIKLGTYYFNMLLEDYDGVYPFAIAGYNAGPNRVKSWIKRYGDPNKKEISFIDWIELIRFSETRNYVQRVIENINVYKFVLNNNKPIRIDSFFRE